MITWTLDGNPIRMADWDATAAVNLGYDTARGTVPRSDAVGARQGDVLTAYRTDASVMWQGRLVQPPRVREGIATLEAAGHGRRLRNAARPMLYQFTEIDAWVPADADPHRYTISEKFEMQINPGRMTFEIVKDETFAAGAKVRAVLWLEGNRISKVSYDWRLLNVAANFDIELLSGSGPGGTLTLEHTQNLGSTTSGTRTVNLTGSGDLIALGLTAAGSTPSTKNKVTIDGIRVWGRTTADTYTSGEVAADIAAMTDLDPSGVEGTDANILPLLFEVSPSQDRLDFLAALEDLRWLVLDDRGAGPWLDFGPYDRTWRVTEERGAAYDLIDLERYDEVRVNFRAPTGRSRTITAEADADLAFSNTYEFEWELPQANSGLASAVAERLVTRLSERRVTGSVEAREVTDEAGRYRAGHDVLPGDLLDLADQPDIGPQRIVRVAWREDGVRLDLEADVDLTRLLRGKERRRLVRASM